MPYKIPETKEEWWGNVDTHWSDLRSILNLYLPTSNLEKINTDDTEGASRVIFSSEPMWVVIQTAKENRDPILARYFFAAWESAPDNQSIHRIPGWGALCDLLSEEYALYEEEENGTLCSGNEGRWPV
jgi:hypothetical protein